ncbi:uncharacterized protein RHOBADRAFT_53827 [Rhodotorula graminis WP1]|uniref:Proteophosphoglycan ppg4 n=1 Tax=Rhodotorula graminis (strain WP1) TaxID=578459 RepID=A0A194S2Z5_RHOGW|nr:uncharacterized protein RHOBADRAFT_53827 [Rhodotorula graminis WP1]KPV74899.1 hypothetical protein RHOBADRAFT_53827 [Rhodotorula graminis WP1]
MLAMAQPQHPTSLEQGSRRLKKGDGKDKLKHRLSMAFKNPFSSSSSSSKNKSADPVNAPAAPRHAPSSSSAPVVRPKSSSRVLPAPAYEHRRDSGESTRRRTAEPAARRTQAGPAVVGTSPPLPPLPRHEGPAAQVDSRAIAQPDGGFSSRVEPLLPSYSSRPGSEVSMSGLGIGVELPVSNPPPVLSRSVQRAPTPPQAEVQPLEVRRPTPPPAQQPQQSAPAHPAASTSRSAQPSDPLMTGRDRIAFLREGGRSSVSSESGVNARLTAPRGANRADATKSLTIGAMPAGFEVPLATAPRAPLKPLQLASRRSSAALEHSRHSSIDHSRRSSFAIDQSRRSSLAPEPSRRSSLGPEHSLATASTSRSQARRPSESLCRRPMINVATQTPRDWAASVSHALASSSSSRPSWTHAVSTPPQAYGAFPVPPPVPPHDTPPQRHGISPSIYSVASFDPRASISAPLPEWPEAPELLAPINYDLPYLTPRVDEDYASVVRQLDELATPVPRSLVEEAIEQSRLAAALPSSTAERTPTIPAAHKPTTASMGYLPPTYAMAEADELVLSTHRSRTPSPVPALSHGHSSADEGDSSSRDSRRASSTLSSPRRSTDDGSEPLTPPTSAVSSVFPELAHAHVEVARTKVSDGDDEADEAVVTIRRASLVTSQVRKASLVSPKTSRPASVVSAAVRHGSISSIQEHRTSVASNTSSGLGVGASASTGAAELVVVAALSTDGPSPAHAVLVTKDAPVDVAETAQPAPVTSSTASPGLEHPRPRPRPAAAYSSAATLPTRRNSEPFPSLVAGPRLRQPGSVMSGADRASRGRSFFLVQALMGESQPEGMVRDWAKDEESEDESDGEVSVLGGESELDEEEDEEDEA